MVKNVMIFLGGVAIGAISSFYYTKLLLEDKYHKMADEEINEMKKYYDDMLDELMVTDTEKPAQIKRAISEVTKEAQSTKKEKTIISPITKNYQEFYTDPADFESPNEGDDEAAEMDSWHEKNKRKRPRLISAEDVENLPACVDHKCLYFYVYDETVTDEDDMPIEDVERLIDNALYEYDFVNSEETLIFVINYQLDTVYEIAKVYAAWADNNAE